MDNHFTYHRMSGNSLLLNVLSAGQDAVCNRFHAAHAIQAYYKNDVVINHGVESLLVMWPSHLLTQSLIATVKNLVNTPKNSILKTGTNWKLPIYYNRAAADLLEVAQQLGMPVERVITLHKAAVYDVACMGFLPGFPYLSGLPAQLNVARKAIPAIKVAAGAVAIAAAMCGIYPQESPGGWYVLGNCPIPLFDKERARPFLLKTMDSLSFYEIDLVAFKQLTQEAKTLNLNNFKHG